MTELEAALALAQSYRQECHDLRGQLQIVTTRLVLAQHETRVARRERDAAIEALAEILAATEPVTDP